VLIQLDSYAVATQKPRRRHYAMFIRLFVRSPEQNILLPRHLMSGLNSFDESDREYSLAPTDDLIRSRRRSWGVNVHLLITLPATTVVKYCNEHVCLSVCLSVREHISRTTRAIFTELFVHVVCDRGSVLLRRGDEILRGMGNFGSFLPH